MPAAPKMWTVDHLGLLSHQKQNLSDTARNRSHIRMLLIASAPYERVAMRVALDMAEC